MTDIIEYKNSKLYCNDIYVSNLKDDNNEYLLKISVDGNFKKSIIFFKNDLYVGPSVKYSLNNSDKSGVNVIVGQSSNSHFTPLYNITLANNSHCTFQFTLLSYNNLGSSASFSGFIKCDKINDVFSFVMSNYIKIVDSDLEIKKLEVIIKNESLGVAGSASPLNHKLLLHSIYI